MSTKKQRCNTSTCSTNHHPLSRKRTTPAISSSSSSSTNNSNHKQNTSSSSASSSLSSSSSSSTYLRYVSSIFLLIIISCWFLLETSKWFSSSSSLPFFTSSSSSSSPFSSKLQQQQHLRAKKSGGEGGEGEELEILNNNNTSSTVHDVKEQNHHPEWSVIISSPDDDETTSTTNTLQKKEEEEETRKKYSPTAAAAAAADDDDSGYSEKQEELEYYLAPLGILRQYKQWHGVQALQREWEEEEENNKKSSSTNNNNNHDNMMRSNSEMRQRKFAVALYWCPDRAGNVLSSLFNTITWAIITNRTLLFQWDVDNPPQNNETLCDSQILQRQSWIPLFHDWKHRISTLPRDEEKTARLLPPISLSMDTTRRVYDEMLPLVYFPMIKDVLYNHKKKNKNDNNSSSVDASKKKNPQRQQDDDDNDNDDDDDLRPRGRGSIIYRNEWNDHPLHLFHYQQYIFDMPKHQQHIMARLYSEGVEFLYGLLFEEFFTLFPLEQQQERQQQPHATAAAAAVAQDDNDAALLDTATSTFHVVLHSRHIAPADDGSFVNYEMACLEQVLNQHYYYNFANNTNNTSSRNKQHECRIVVMSDRPKTVILLRKWLQEHAVYRSACTVLTTLDGNDESNDTGSAARTATPGPVAEHGPHAGLGFFRDLQLVQQEQQRRGGSSSGNGGMLASSSSALIGDVAKSSFTLVKNIVTYHHRLQQVQRALFLNDNNKNETTTTPIKMYSTTPSWNTDQGDRLPWLCKLPPRPLTGYNYGPDTPTFYRNVKDAPLLKPQRMLQEYQKQHNQEALVREVDYNNGPSSLLSSSSSSPPSWRKFGLVTLDCNDTRSQRPFVDYEHTFLNGMVWAMLTNRTLLWRTTGTPAALNDTTMTTATNENDACGLQIQSRIPRWDEWSVRWHLIEGASFDDDDSDDKDVVTIILPTTPISTNSKLRLKVGRRRSTARQLLEYGIDFLNGMLFLQVFQESSTTKEDNASMKTPLIQTASSAVAQPVEAMAANIIILEDYDDGYSISSASATSDGNDDGNLVTTHMKRLSACLDQVLGELQNGTDMMLPCLVIRIGTKISRQQDHDEDNDANRSPLQQVMANHNCTIILQQELQQPRRHASRDALSFLQNVKPFLLPPSSSYNINARRSTALFQGWIGQRPSFLLEAIEYQKVMQARERFPIETTPALRTCNLESSRITQTRRS